MKPSTRLRPLIRGLRGKIPGVVLFFLRGLEMLQNICGMLEVTVPFAAVMLQNSMPLLAKGIWDPAKALPAPPGLPFETYSMPFKGENLEPSENA